MAIEPDDISRDVVDQCSLTGCPPYKNAVSSILEFALDDPHTRAALVRELIERGACSPCVWAVESVSHAFVVSLHEDEAEASQSAKRLHEINGRIFGVRHWKGETE